MSAPIWYTKQSNLGVIQEGAFYQFGLDAQDPSGDDVVYSLVAGKLPDGIELSITGTLFGQPKKLIKGIPFEVSQDVNAYSPSILLSGDTPFGKCTRISTSLAVLSSILLILIFPFSLAFKIESISVDVVVEKGI